MYSRTVLLVQGERNLYLNDSRKGDRLYNGEIGGYENARHPGYPKVRCASELKYHRNHTGFA
jgi:hypothetical protein